MGGVVRGAGHGHVLAGGVWLRAALEGCEGGPAYHGCWLRVWVGVRRVGMGSGSLGCVDEGRRSSSSVVEWVRKRRGEAEGVSDTAGGAGEMIAG